MHYSQKDLCVAEEHVAAAKRRVARQRQLLVHAIWNHESLRHAIELLDVLEAILKQHKKRRDLISASLDTNR